MCVFNIFKKIIIIITQLFYFFIDLKSKCEDDASILALFENYEINKLDINRIYRYLDKFIKETAEDLDDIADDISAGD